MRCGKWLVLVVLMNAACSGRETAPLVDAGLDGTHALDQAPVTDQSLPDLLAPDAAPTPCSPCTDPQACCAPEEIKCYGDPNTGIICTCPTLWDCSADPNTCQQELPMPGSSTGWSCSWTPTKYVCTKTASSLPPDVESNWSCAAGGSGWECTMSFPPNPCNSTDGLAFWTCTVDAAAGKLVCTTNSPPPPCSTGKWSCSTGSNGLVSCQRTDQTGLPAGGANWKCHTANKLGKPIWYCYGEVPQGGAPPYAWSCTKFRTELGKDVYHCDVPVDPCERPPGGGSWACFKGSAFGGTRCEATGSACLPGQKRWCDGLVYSGWGQVTCQADGTWKTTIINGQTVLDCQETGAVPDTVCACYHYFFNPTCCERADCILPAGSTGQTCAASAGALCDYCNPTSPECKEADAKCIVTNAHETFCGKSCSSVPCPSGYTCMTVKLQTGTAKQCVPADMSCYY